MHTWAASSSSLASVLSEAVVVKAVLPSTSADAAMPAATAPARSAEAVRSEAKYDLLAPHRQLSCSVSG